MCGLFCGFRKGKKCVASSVTGDLNNCEEAGKRTRQIFIFIFLIYYYC